MNKYAKEIQALAEVFFNATAQAKDVSKAATQYKHLLRELARLNLNTSENQDPVLSSNGLAVSLQTAADCIDDYWRTQKFIYGIHEAIAAKISQGKKHLNILYAGTGPFAALLIPNMLKFSHEDIQFTLMEINPVTAEVLKGVLAKLDLMHSGVKIVCADASKYELQEVYDLMISETMQAALAREQQVSVYLNLMRQAHEETVFIPEKIDISLGIRATGLPNYEISPENCQPVERVFEVSKKGMFDYLQEIGIPSVFPKSSVRIETSKMKHSDLLLLLTHIQVYQEVVLEPMDSELTRTLILDNIADKTDAELQVDVQYIIDQEPRFEFAVIRSKAQGAVPICTPNDYIRCQ